MNHKTKCHMRPKYMLQGLSYCSINQPLGVCLWGCFFLTQEINEKSVENSLTKSKNHIRTKVVVTEKLSGFLVKAFSKF